MKTVRIAFVGSGKPRIIFISDEGALFSGFPLGNINESIVQISNNLAGIVRCVRRGSDLKRTAIEFYHRFPPACLALCIAPTPSGSDVRIEFRDFPKADHLGGVDMNSESKLVHETTLSPRQLADMLYHVLDEFLEFCLMDFYRTDRQSSKHILDAIIIYDTEGKNLEWPQAAVQDLLPITAALER